MTTPYRKPCDQYPDPPDPPKPWGESGWQRRLVYLTGYSSVLVLTLVSIVIRVQEVFIAALILGGLLFCIGVSKHVVRFVRTGKWPIDE